MLDSENHRKKSAENECEQDPVSTVIGEYGRWQLLMTFLLSLFNIPCTSHIFLPTFVAAQKTFWCAAPQHLADIEPQVWREFSQPSGPCSLLDLPWDNVTVGQVESGVAPASNLTRCTKWTFEGTGSTIISEWELVCSREQLTNIGEMVFLAGVALGGFVSGMISDKWGRKRTLMTLTVLQTVIGLSISFAPWFTAYLVLRFALGAISVGIVFGGFVLSLELVGGVWRTVAGISYLFPVSLTYCMVAGAGWFLRNWRHLQLAVSIPGFFLLLLWFIIPESPRWLMALRRKKEVLVILEKAAKYNRRQIPVDVERILFSDKSRCAQQDERSVGVADLFKTPRMRIITSCLFVIWFSVYLSYYGLVLNVGNIGGDLYVNSVLSGVVEIPALAVSVLLLIKVGRRWPLCLTQVLGGGACLLTLAVPSRTQWATTALAMLAKFSVSSANAMIPVFTAELYPTVIRNLGVGASNVPAGVALILVPYLWNLATMSQMVPMAVLGGISIIGGIAILKLPETGNKPLAGTLQDQECEQNDQAKAQSAVNNSYSIKYTEHM